MNSDDSNQGGDAQSESTADVQPYMPIAVGFYLLSLPLFVAGIFLSDTPSATWSNLIAGLVMAGLGGLLHWRSR